MKNYSSAVCLLIIMLSFFSCKKDNNSDSTDYTFRKTTWGMTKEQVKSSEKSTYIYAFSNDSVLAYQSENAGEYYLYIFDSNDKLAEAYREFTWTHSSNYNLYLSDYDSIKTELTKQYGTPIFDTIAWNDDSLKPYKDKWGQALMEGNLEYGTGWENSKVIVYLQMYASGNYFNFGVIYASPFSFSLKKKSTSVAKLELFKNLIKQ